MVKSANEHHGYVDGLIHDETRKQNKKVHQDGVITLVGYADMGEDKNLSNAERCFRNNKREAMFGINRPKNLLLQKKYFNPILSCLSFLYERTTGSRKCSHY